jgi:integrase
MRKNKSWKDLVTEYLEHRKRFGNDLTRNSYVLYLFAKHLDEIKFKGHLTSLVQIEWLKNLEGKTSFNRARKLVMLRQFARYLSIFDPKTELPQSGFFGKAQPNFKPHIFSDNELKLVFSTLRKVLKCEGSFSLVTYEYAFGLILACGLRASEVTNLFVDDVDFKNGLLRIVESKFKKTRLVPIDPTVVNALRDYKTMRDMTFPRCKATTFFVLKGNHPFTYSGMQSVFFKIKTKLGWRSNNQRRVHDLRHTFVVKRLIEWHRKGIDSEKKIAALSVYLGHAKVTDTYRYFHFTPELMDIISIRFEKLSPNFEEVA